MAFRWRLTRNVLHHQSDRFRQVPSLAQVPQQALGTLQIPNGPGNQFDKSGNNNGLVRY
jgi:hypothetical protein